MISTEKIKNLSLVIELLDENGKIIDIKNISKQFDRGKDNFKEEIDINDSVKSINIKDCSIVGDGDFTIIKK